MAVNSFGNIDYTVPGSGMTLLSTTTLTGASVTISSIPATYNKLEIYIVNFIPATDGSRLQIRMNADATANRHATSTGAFSTTFFDFFENQDNAVSQSLWHLTLPNYANTTTWKMCTNYGFSNNSTTPTSVSLTGMGPTGVYNQTTAISSLQFFSNSGNMTSGSVLLYGVK